MKILIADDDPVSRKLVSSLLGKWEFDVVCAEDGEQALEKLKASDGDVEMAVVDWTMPKMNGLRLCEAIRSGDFERYIYILMLTGKNQKEDVIQAFEAGADDFISKPVQKDELKSRINVGCRIVEFKRELSEKNAQLTKSNEMLGKYASDMEELAEERAKQLVHSERLSTLGEMAAGIAHEINNYLAPITGYTDMLQIGAMDCGGSPEKQRQFLGDIGPYITGIKTSAERIRLLVQRIRSHSRTEAMDKSACDINDIIEQSLELCVNQVKRMSLTKNLKDDLPLTHVSINEIEQVIVNLIKNAGDELTDQSDQKLIISTSADGRNVIVTIEDNGPGIPEANLQKIWQSFFTTKEEEKGTGLGLSICKSIVESHNGSIEADNRPEGGARFTIKLPVASGFTD